MRSDKQQLEALKKRYDKDRDRWVEQTNEYHDKFEDIKRRAKEALLKMKEQVEHHVQAASDARITAEKYMIKNMELEDEIEKLRKDS
jgi:4-hydroxy-3-methylbut-2-enyl diphosphate reductase IspH